MLGGGQSKSSLGSLGVCLEGGGDVFTREFGYMLGGGQSKPSLGSLDICWEWGGASLHWGVWVHVGWGEKQAFAREFGYKLGVGQSYLH